MSPARMDHNNSELLTDPGGEPGLHTDSDVPQFFRAQTERRRCNTCAVNEDLTTDGSWSQRSLSRSLQRAELLLRSTLNPSLKWLFNPRGQNDEDVEEGNYVLAHNLVSRSSARLLRLQHALLTVAPQWLPVGGAQSMSTQVCGRSISGECGLLPCSSSLQMMYGTLRRLQEQRSLLLFIHEFSRRAHLAAAFTSRLAHLLEREYHTQARSGCSWFHLVSLSQELRVHVSHWSCLQSKVKSDPYLRAALVQQTRQLLLQEVRQSLELLALQALTLMEHYVYLVLRAVVRTDLNSVPKEVLEDVLAGTELYNQAGGEQKAQHRDTQRRMAILPQSHNPTLGPGLSPRRGRHPAEISITDLMVVLAEHHVQRATQQLLTWSSEPSFNRCPVHGNHTGSEWTWDQLQHTCLRAYSTHQHPLQASSLHISSHHNPPGLLLDQNHGPEPVTVQHRTEEGRTDLYQRPKHSGLQQTGPETLGSSRRARLSMELLVQLLVSSGELLAPLTLQTPEHLGTHVKETLALNPPETDLNKDLNQDQQVDRPGPENTDRQVGSAGSEGSCPSPSVRWLDLGCSVQVAGVLAQYRPLMVTLRSRALWLQLLAPPAATSSINLQDPHSRFSLLQRVRQAAHTGLLTQESKDLLEELDTHLFASTAHAQWDYEVCIALGSALKDRCVTGVSHQGAMMSQTMKHFLCLPPPLMSSLSCCQSLSRGSGNLTCSLRLPPFTLSLHTCTISLALATVQLSTVWVMSKSFLFLSSWKLKKFLLVSQGDLKVLINMLHLLLCQTMLLSSDLQLSVYQQHLLRRKLTHLEGAVSKLQVFSAEVLMMFSYDCKRTSGEIFEQNMPSATHWRPRIRTESPSSPSEYASLAAQAVIGQVLDGVASLSEDARTQTLSVALTAFLEAWMEHILRHRIKFSIQGALQLKLDFDSIRAMIQSEKYSLSPDLHQRLLSLRVFQQVDSAVVCLLQQPQAKSYLQTGAWKPFTHCCPTHSNRGSIDSVVGSSITNLRCMEGEELTHTDPSLVTSDLRPVNPSNPGEPYLAPSAALGVAQQDWLDLRIHSTARRWRLPGLHCVLKSEP